jgi:hypothetical protein
MEAVFGSEQVESERPGDGMQTSALDQVLEAILPTRG